MRVLVPRLRRRIVFFLGGGIGLLEPCVPVLGGNTPHPLGSAAKVTVEGARLCAHLVVRAKARRHPPTDIFAWRCGGSRHVFGGSALCLLNQKSVVLRWCEYMQLASPHLELTCESVYSFVAGHLAATAGGPGSAPPPPDMALVTSRGGPGRPIAISGEGARPSVVASAKRYSNHLNTHMFKHLARTL